MKSRVAEKNSRVLRTKTDPTPRPQIKIQFRNKFFFEITLLPSCRLLQTFCIIDNEIGSKVGKHLKLHAYLCTIYIPISKAIPFDDADSPRVPGDTAWQQRKEKRNIIP